MAEAVPLTPLRRLLFAFVALFKVLFDRAFAESVWALHREGKAALPAVRPEPQPAADPNLRALHLLSVLQRDGRFVDFLQEDIQPFSDAEVGAAARAVHEGCRKGLLGALQLAPVIDEPEGAQVAVELGFDAAQIRLTGNVVGSPPFRGTLKHHGWKVASVAWPDPPKGYDGRILAPAEVELA